MISIMYRVVAVCLLTFSISVAADESPSVCKQMDDVLTELRSLRKLLEQSAAPERASAKIDVGDAIGLGSPDAPVTVVEFVDYQCPFCQRFYKDTFADLKSLYIDSGKVRFYSLDLPLEIHPKAFLAAEVIQCAGEQGHFWEMYDRLQTKPDEFGKDMLLAYAKSLALAGC